MVIYIKKKRLSMKIAASRLLVGDRRRTWSGRCVMLRSRLPPEVRYGTAYLVPDFVTDCEPQILPELLLGLLTAPHCEFFTS